MDNPELAQANTDQLSPSQQLIEKKKKRFFRGLKILKLLILAGVIMAVVISISVVVYNKNKQTYVVSSKDPDDVPSVVETQPEKVMETTKEYYNTPHKFYIKFPLEDSFETMESTGNENLLIKIFSKDIDPKENVDEYNIIKGYIVKVSPLVITTRSVDELILVKKENYLVNCPQTAEISDVYSAEVNGFLTKRFNIVNCNSDQIISYLSINDYVYEIVQIFKGDVGFKQVYKNATDQIVSTLNFIIVGEKVLQSPFVKFEDSTLGLLFEYQVELDTDCCVVAPPPYGKPEKIIVLAENSNENTIGVFIDKNNEGLPFGEYVQRQKNLLIDDFTVVKGTAPSGVEQEFVINDAKGVMLKDFSWKGNDLIFVPLQKTNHILILSKTNINQEIFDTIIKSFRIFTPAS